MDTAEHSLGKAAKLASWALQLVIAAILVQTLFFKFTGAEESVYIFETMGMEPWGRIGTGAVELVASVLLVIPGFAVPGAALALGTMVGALGGHLVGPLGIEVQGDGGTLFAMALAVFLASAVVLFLRRGEVQRWVRPLMSRRGATESP